jgi:16S rRNA G1207 methylase RsmC
MTRGNAGARGAWPARVVRRLYPKPTNAGAALSPQALTVEDVDGTRVIVLPDVFNGIRFHTGAFLASSLTADVIGRGNRVLDLGTGSGVCAVFAGRLAAHVVATDINPEAVRCASINALAHHLEDVIETRLGDLFTPVAGERFDVVLFNPPYFRGVAHDAADHALRSPDTFDRFLREVGDHLGEHGRALVVLSPDTDIEDALWSASHLAVTRFRTRRVLGKTLTIYELRPQ